MLAVRKISGCPLGRTSLQRGIRDLRQQRAPSKHWTSPFLVGRPTVILLIKQHLLLDIRSRQRHAGAVADGVDERVPGEAVEHVVVRWTT